MCVQVGFRGVQGREWLMYQRSTGVFVVVLVQESDGGVRKLLHTFMTEFGGVRRSACHGEALSREECFESGVHW